jgi:cellulose synthase/poly-beta-1,6-N-acetylglucosamine synthase-like glycosyltransferase
LAALGALYGLWSQRNGWGRSPLFAFAYFAVSLFPLLGFFNVYYFRFSYVADHFQYLASMGPLALAGAGLARLPVWLAQDRR